MIHRRLSQITILINMQVLKFFKNCETPTSLQSKQCFFYQVNLCCFMLLWLGIKGVLLSVRSFTSQSNVELSCMYSNTGFMVRTCRVSKWNLRRNQKCKVHKKVLKVKRALKAVNQLKTRKKLIVGNTLNRLFVLNNATNRQSAKSEE